MFKLRDVHRQAFQRLAIQEFIRRALAYLRQELPEKMNGLSDSEQEQLIRRAMNNSYGLTGERAIVSLAQLRLLLGENFAEQPEWQWAVEALRDSTRDPNERAEWVVTVACALRPPR